MNDELRRQALRSCTKEQLIEALERMGETVTLETARKALILCCYVDGYMCGYQAFGDTGYNRVVTDPIRYIKESPSLNEEERDLAVEMLKTVRKLRATPSPTDSKTQA